MYLTAIIYKRNQPIILTNFVDNYNYPKVLLIIFSMFYNKKLVLFNAVKEVYRTAGDLVIGKPPRRRKPWMSALIEMRNNLKKDIEATPVCSLSALESEYKTKTEKLSEALGVTRGYMLRNCLKVMKRQHLSVIWEKFIKSQRT